MLAANNVGHGIHGVHAHQHRLARADISLDHCQMLDLIDLTLVRDHPPVVAVRRAHKPLFHGFHQPLRGAAVGDKVGDGAELEIMALRVGHQIRQTGHGAVVVHDFADHAGGGQPGQTGDVHCGFRMAGADQRAAVTCH